MKILETKRLIIREYSMDDFNDLYKLLSDPVTMKYYPKAYDEIGTKRWIDWSLQNYKKYGFGWWALILKETGEFIGDCGITMQNIDGQILPEIGYHIYKDYWRKGYAKEAASAIKDWAFKHTTFTELYSYMSSDNVASYSTAESIGMVKIKSFFEDNEENLVYKISK